MDYLKPSYISTPTKKGRIELAIFFDERDNVESPLAKELSRIGTIEEVRREENAVRLLGHPIKRETKLFNFYYTHLDKVLERVRHVTAHNTEEYDDKFSDELRQKIVESDGVYLRDFSYRLFPDYSISKQDVEISMKKYGISSAYMHSFDIKSAKCLERTAVGISLARALGFEAKAVGIEEMTSNCWRKIQKKVPEFDISGIVENSYEIWERKRHALSMGYLFIVDTLGVNLTKDIGYDAYIRRSRALVENFNNIDTAKMQNPFPNFHVWFKIKINGQWHHVQTLPVVHEKDAFGTAIDKTLEEIAVDALEVTEDELKGKKVKRHYIEGNQMKFQEVDW